MKKNNQHTFRATKEDDALINALCHKTKRPLANLVRYALWRLALDEGVAIFPDPEPLIVPKEVMTLEVPVKRP